MNLTPKNEHYVSCGDALDKVGKNFAKPLPVRVKNNFVARLVALAKIRKAMVK